jgi:hypothetical protein
MTSTLQSRQLVRSQPYGTQKVYIQQIVANNGVLEASFDISVVIADRNQLAAQASVTGVASVGPYLDVMVLSDVIGTVDILFQVDNGGLARSVLAAPLPVAAGTVLTVSGLRVTARYVYVDYTNTSGGNATTDFGCFMRSN